MSVLLEFRASNSKLTKSDIAPTMSFTATTGRGQLSVNASKSVSRADEGRPDWWRHLIGAGLLSVVKNCLTFAIPATLLWEYPLVRASHDLKLLLLVFGTIVVVHLTQGFLGVWRLHVFRQAAYEFREHYGGPEYLFRGASQTPPVDYQSDVFRVKSIIAEDGLGVVLDFPWIVPLLLVLAHISVWLAATSLLFTLLIVALTIGRQRMRSRLEALDQERASGLLRIPLSAIGLHRALISRENLARLHFELRSTTYRAAKRALRNDDTLRTFARTLKSVQAVVLLGVAFYLTFSLNASIGILMVAAFLAPRISDPAEALVINWQRITIAFKAWQRINNLPTRDSIRARPSLTPADAGVRVEDVSIGFPLAVEPILTNVSFDLGPSDVLTIVGGAGSGKTVLANTLAGCLPAKSGQIFMGGIERSNLCDEAAVRMTGYLPQYDRFYPGTIAQNVSGFMDWVDDSEIARALESIGIDQIVARMKNGVNSRIDDTLSLGFRKKLAIARAAFGSPRLLILDEPLAHLDEEGVCRLFDLLRGHQCRGGISILLTARVERLPFANRFGTIEGKKLTMAALGLVAAQ